jgi:2-C-methyl-D-erythritol 4-phosphate cytidylyltransferase
MSKVLQRKKIKSSPAKTTANPTLDTIKMVEQTLSKMREYPSKNRLWRALPRQVQYPTFKVVLNYLEESCKILYDKDGAIVWIYADNPKIRKLMRTSVSLL